MMHRWNENEIFSVPTQLCSALYPHASSGWEEDNEGPCEFRTPAPVVFALFSHHLLRDYGTSRLRHDILWTTATSEMVVFNIMVVCVAAYYGVCIYPRVPDPRLYLFPDNIQNGELGRLFRLLPTLLSP